MRLLAGLFVLLLMASPAIPMFYDVAHDVQAASLDSWTKVLHLHEGAIYTTGDYDWLNSTGPSNPSSTDYDRDGVPGISIKKNVPPQRWHHWVMWPSANSDIVITGDIDARIWAKDKDNESGSRIRAIFWDMGPGELGSQSMWSEIGNDTVDLLGVNYPEYDLSHLTVTVGSYTLAQGHSLVLSIQRGDSYNQWLSVMYDTNDLDSTVTLRTNDFVSVDTAWTEDANNLSRSTFSDQESAVVVANVSDPFGAYDITNATAAVYYQSNGTAAVPSEEMRLVRTDPSSAKAWKLFNHTLPLLTAGNYTVNVSASDPGGSPSWLALPLTVVSVDHFNVTAPAAVVAGSLFSMTITAMDSSDAIVSDWVGAVQLEAFKADMTTPGNGSLANQSVFITPGDSGQIAVADQSYGFGEETIRIKASAGTRYGWSGLISVSSGPVVNVTLVPSSTQTIESGSSRGFTVTGRDANGNINTAWTPSWTSTTDLGSIVGAGLSVVFIADKVGSGWINCSNAVTGANNSTGIIVVAGLLTRIEVSPSTLVINESETQAMTAVGYDSKGNIVSIADARWYTNVGSISGVGPSAVFTAGFMPEVGAIECRKDNIVGSIQVEVKTGRWSPSLSPIPMQIRNEDSGSWELSLSGIWHNQNGTSLLSWWVEDVNTRLYFVSHDPLSNAVMQFYTQPDQSGDDTFILWVVNPDGYWAYQEVTVRIIPVNDKPVFVNSPPTELYVKFDTPYTFDYSYFVSDVDNAQTELSLSVTPSSVQSDIFFDGMIATFIFPKEDGNSPYFKIVTLTVSDISGASSEMRLVVRVTNDNPPDMTTSLPDVTINEGAMDFFVFDLDDYFYDIDSAFLIYTSGFQHITVDIDPMTHHVNLSAPEEWSGITQGMFTATDPVGALKTDTITVTVLPVNDQPQVRSPGTIHVKYDVPYFLYLSPYVTDPDDTLDSLTFVFNNSNVTHTSTFAGNHRLELNFSGPASAVPYMAYVKMIVSDPQGASAPCDFEVLVTDDEPPSVTVPNPDQVYYSFPEDTYLNNTMRMYDLFADPDDASMTFLISGATNVHFTISSDGVVNLTAEANWSGMEKIDITAIDDRGGWAMLQAYVMVTEVNDAPFIKKIPDVISSGGSRNFRIPIYQFIFDSDTPYSKLVVTATPQDSTVSVVGEYLYISLPSDQDVVTIQIQASDGDLLSNTMTFKAGVAKDIAQKIGWPYSFPLVLLAAAVGAYFVSIRIPRPYALDNLFLIHNDGRLVAHVTREENMTLDKDIVSAMFTAVQEFVRDSFQKGEVGLKKLEIGEKSVVIEKGQSTYLALIYAGWPPKDTFDMLSMLLRDIEERYKGRLEKWNGTMKTVKGVDKMLQEYMANAFKPGTWHEEEEIAEAEWVDILDKEA
ncbi:MAG: hypothetical protein KJ653_08510 [Candidatus Thermoplasmatota archaeon]|nr:hypothetical protein [Candidatus Thermoplasmatota archaeon]MBU1913764.1 hypothetical protein [Candidatus Thermoplasmatota archaeon]